MGVKTAGMVLLVLAAVTSNYQCFAQDNGDAASLPFIPLPNNLALRAHANNAGAGGWVSTAASAPATRGSPSPSQISLSDPSLLGNIPTGTNPTDVVDVVDFPTASDSQRWSNNVAPLSAYVVTQLQAGAGKAQLQFGLSCPGLFKLGADENGLLFADSCPPSEGDAGATPASETRHSTNIRVAGEITFIAIAFHEDTKTVAVYVNSSSPVATFPHQGSSAVDGITLYGPQQVSDVIAHAFEYTQPYIYALNTHYWPLLNNGRRADPVQTVEDSAGDDDAEGDNGGTDSGGDQGSDDQQGHAEPSTGDGEGEIDNNNDDDNAAGSNDDAVGSADDDDDEWTTCQNGFNLHTGAECQCTFGCARCQESSVDPVSPPLCTLCISNQLILHEGLCWLNCPEGYEAVESGDNGERTCHEVQDNTGSSGAGAGAGDGGDDDDDDGSAESGTDNADDDGVDSGDDDSSDDNESSNGDSSNSSSSGVDATLVAGIGLGLVVVAILVVIAVVAVKRKRQRQRQDALMQLEAGYIDN